MFGLIAPSLISVLAALVLGGSLDHWSRARMRWWPLALVALGLQIPLYTWPVKTWSLVVAAGAGASVATTGLVLLVILRNAVGPLRAAAGLAALGIALNVAVMLANGGWMPRADDLMPPPVDRGDLAATVSNTAPVSADTRLGWLGDIIPQPRWLPMRDLVSAGDMLLSIGAAWYAFAVTRGRMLPHRSRPHG